MNYIMGTGHTEGERVVTEKIELFATCQACGAKNIVRIDGDEHAVKTNCENCGEIIIVNLAVCNE